MTSVRVIRPLWGDVTYTQAVIDEFEPGILTVSSDERGDRVLETYRADQWTIAQQFDQQGYEEKFLKNAHISDLKVSA